MPIATIETGTPLKQPVNETKPLLDEKRRTSGVASRKPAIISALGTEPTVTILLAKSPLVNC